MVCECKISGLFSTSPYTGIISATLTGSQEFIDVISTCSQGPNVFQEVRKKLKGPSAGSLQITAYAFPQGSTDRFLGTSCPSSAGVSFPVQQRFDCENNKTYFIRTKTGEAFREGDPINGIILLGEFCSFRTVSASAQSGPATRITDTTRFLGQDLIWTGTPIPFDSRDADTLDITILGLDCKLTQFSVEVSAPSVATNSYSFSYEISSCSGA